MLRPPPTRPPSALVPQVITGTTQASETSGSGSGCVAQRDNVLVRTAISLEDVLLRNISPCPLGAYVLPSPASYFLWDGVSFYNRVTTPLDADSVFKFHIAFPQTFPDHPPGVEFVTEIFNPLVSHAGAFNLGHHYKHWRADQHHIIYALRWIKTSFKKNKLDSIQESD